MIRIVRASTISTNTATTSNTINATTTDLLLVDERRRALDLRHLDLHPRLEHLTFHVGTGAPLLAADAHAAAVSVDPLEHGRLRPDERSRPGPHDRRHVEVRARERTEERERAKRACDEDDQLHNRAYAERP